MLDMNEKVVLVTGATNGIGEAAALELARMGATTLVVSRSESKCRATVSSIQQQTGNADVHYYTADLSAQEQVRRVAAEIRRDYDRLDVLLNNAGAWFAERKLSPDGIEMTWALNHLNYFLLTNELLDLLKSTAAAHGEARVVSVSSMAHHGGQMHWDNLAFKDNWDTEGRGATGPGWAVYSQSKLANVLFAYGLARRMEGTGVTSNAVHPGVVVTGFSQNNGLIYKLAAPLRRLRNRNKPIDGARPAIYAASAPEMQGVTGKYYGPPHNEEESSPTTHDTDAQDRLWAISEEMVKQSAPASA